MEMNVLCVIDSFGNGGAQRQLVNIACGLKQRGHRVEFFVYHAGDFYRPILEESSISIHLLTKKSRFALRPVLDLGRLLRQGGFDRVIAFLETPSVYAEIACIGLKRIRLVVSERSMAPYGNLTVPRMIKAQLHRLADVVTTNSHSHREWMAKSFPWLESRLTTIYNGIDLDQFRPASVHKANSQLRILGLGRVSEAKNIPGLVQAIRLCRFEGKINVRVDWAGRTDESRALELAMASLEQAQIKECWRWLGTRERVHDLMHEYDALILPSLWEGLPNVICEALASGLPVLASRVSDIPRLVEDGVSGFLFDPSDPEEMARVIARFDALPTRERIRMGTAGRAFAVRELSMEKCINAYEHILAETIPQNVVGHLPSKSVRRA